jgi:ribonuclease HII
MPVSSSRQKHIPRAPSLKFEKNLWSKGLMHIAGVDEVGRGAWAGPVFAAAVILPHDRTARTRAALRGVNDSKKLTTPQRAAMRERIHAVALAWAVGCASNAEIDALGIVPATRLAMMRAVTALPLAPAALLIDAVTLPDLPLPQHVFNFADSISLSVAAASILAKTARDAAMCRLSETVPGYGFAAHKGYGTHAHARALAEYGPCWAHRSSFAPIQHILAESASATLDPR